MGNACKVGVNENEYEIQTGQGKFDFKKTVLFFILFKHVRANPKEQRFYDKAEKHIPLGKEGLKRSLSMKRTEKKYLNGNVEVEIF